MKRDIIEITGKEVRTTGQDVWMSAAEIAELFNGFFNAITAFETVYFWSPVNIALSEVARVLREGGCFLISLEASDPELGKMWTERIDGMVVYTPAELEERLHEVGFSSIRTIRKKEEIHIIAYK